MAVQMPRNFAALSHTSITDAALAGPWRGKLEPLLRPSPVAPPEFYYDLLAPRAASLDMWESEYLQVLDGENPVKEWTKGTWLTPLLAALDEPDRSGFEADYAARVAAAYPSRADGKTLFPVPPDVHDRHGALTRGTPGPARCVAFPHPESDHEHSGPAKWPARSL
jgi:trans-aconitate 2-methyltransferase